MNTWARASGLAFLSLTLLAGCGTPIGQTCRSNSDCGQGDLSCTDNTGEHGFRAVGTLSCNRTCQTTADCDQGYCETHERDGQVTGICIYPDSSDVAAVDVGGGYDDGYDPGTYYPDDDGGGGDDGGGYDDGSGDDGSGDDGGGCDDCATHHRKGSRAPKQAMSAAVKVASSNS